MAESNHLKLWIALARAYHAIEAAAAKDVARHGLTIHEFGVLEALYHKGPMRVGEIQNRILVSSGGITYLVDCLIERGLIKREPDPNDARARLATLTPRGKRLLSRIFPEHSDHLSEVMSGLTAGERREATALLRKLGLHAAGTT